MKNISLCFYFPYKEISGVPVLFSRLINYLSSSHNNYNISLIDYEDGATINNIINKHKINHIIFYDRIKVYAPVDSVLILQSILPYAMRPELVINTKTKILFWNLHPDNLVPILFPFPYLRNFQNKNFDLYAKIIKSFWSKNLRRCQVFVESATYKKGLIFMDSSNKNKTEKYLFLNFLSTEYLPVPALSSEFKKAKPETISEKLKISWVGRLCDFKYHILAYTINRIYEFSNKFKTCVVFSIIGDGPFYDELNKLSDRNNQYFELIMLGTINPVELDRTLLNHSDVIVGMGTSALEGAKLGIPTIVLDFSYYTIKQDYKYRWLHDTQNYDLGHDISNDDYLSGNNSIEDMLKLILVEYNVLSQMSLDYFNKYHTISSVSNKLILACNNTEFNFGDIDINLKRKGLTRRLYDKIRGYN